MLEELKKFYSDDPNTPELGGFVLESGLVVHRPNSSPDPLGSFCLAPDDLIKYEEFAVATWHTHPGGGSNLSGDDYIAFKNWPIFQHYIVGKDGIRCYYVDERGNVIEKSD